MASEMTMDALNSLNYKPSPKSKQEDEERRVIREDYRHFMDALSEQKEDLIDPTDGDDMLSKRLSDVDKMFRRVKMTREAALDSASLVRLAELGKMKAQGLKTDFITFNPADFCDKVRLTIAGVTDAADQTGLTEENWVSLGHAVMPFFNHAPTLRFMCGSFERGEVTSVKRTRTREKEKEVQGMATKPEKLTSFADTDRGERTTAQVDHIFSTMWNIYESQNNTPFCFFEFVTNPHSFGHTVENIFYVSFLVRDGHARIFLDDDNLPVIEPLQKEESEKSRNDNVQRHQVVMSLSYKEWQEIIKKFDIEEALIQPMEEVKKEDESKSGKGKGKGKKSILTSHSQNSQTLR